MKHKIPQLMKERGDSKPLTHFFQLDNTYWGEKTVMASEAREQQESPPLSLLCPSMSLAILLKWDLAR